MRLALAVLGVALVAPTFAGCDAFTVPEPFEIDQQRIVGTVTWDLVETDCAPGVLTAWPGSETGVALVEGDRLRLDFASIPIVEGRLAGGEAQVTGEVELMDPAGVRVECLVDGDARLGETHVEGTMTEVLISTGPMNCVSVARFRLEPF